MTRRPNGFTMIELILVMTIMTLIGLFAALAIANMQDRAKLAETKALMDMMETALDEYKRDMGVYPTGDAAAMLSALTQTGGSWTRASSEWFDGRTEIVDGWGMPFHYTSSAEYESSTYGVERTPTKKDWYNTKTFQIYSTGPNMKTWPADVAEGGHPQLQGTEEDDVRNWQHEVFYTPSAYPSG
jgi:general secretion pathway protein G